MHGDGYETGQVPLFHVFVHIFGLDPARNMPFFKKITNQILRLNYAQLICEPVQSENKRLCSSVQFQFLLCILHKISQNYAMLAVSNS